MRSVDGKQLVRFQSENAVFKFLCRSVDVALNSAPVLQLVNILAYTSYRPQIKRKAKITTEGFVFTPVHSY